MTEHSFMVAPAGLVKGATDAAVCVRCDIVRATIKGRVVVGRSPRELRPESATASWQCERIEKEVPRGR